MKGRVIEHFFAAIFCVGACSVLFLHLQDAIKESQPAGRNEVSFQNVERKYSSEHCSISAAKSHNYSGFLRSLLIWEVEETDDEKEVSDFQDDQRNSLEVENRNTFVDLLRESNYVSSVPLFIVLHSWRHFLS